MWCIRRLKKLSWYFSISDLEGREACLREELNLRSDDFKEMVHHLFLKFRGEQEWTIWKEMSVEMVTLDVIPGGMFVGKSQLDDYWFCGWSLETMLFLEFIIKTYEESIEDKHKVKAEVEPHDPNKWIHGQPKNLWSCYTNMHSCHSICQHVVQTPGHNLGFWQIRLGSNIWQMWMWIVDLD